MVLTQPVTPKRHRAPAGVFVLWVLLSAFVRAVCGLGTLGQFGPVLGGASMPIWHALDEGRSDGSLIALLVYPEAAVAVCAVLIALGTAFGLLARNRRAQRIAHVLAWGLLADTILILISAGPWLAAVAVDLTPASWTLVAALATSQLLLVVLGADVVRKLRRLGDVPQGG